MGWSGGTYTKGNAGSGGWAGDASLGIGIEASRHDTQDNDFATGINNCLAKDGQNTPTANLGMGGYKHTGVGNASAADQYMALGQLLDASKAVQTSGTAPNYTVTLSPAPTTYFDGMIVAVKCHSTFTGGSQATINVNGLGAKNIRIRINDGSGSRNVYPYEMLASVGYLLQYDGSQFYLLNPQGGFALDTANKSWLTAGTAPNYTVDIYPAPASYFDGLSFDIQIHDNLTVGTGATLNVNGIGAKDIKVTKWSTNIRNPEQYELSRSSHYRVSYDASLNAFILQNPTFGSRLKSFTATIGSTSGTIVITSQDSRYIFLNGSTVYVEYSLLLDLSGSPSSDISVSLPFSASLTSANKIFGPMYINAAAGESNWLGFPFLMPSGTAIQFYRPNTSDSWQIDNNFLINAWGIYEIA